MDNKGAQGLIKLTEQRVRKIVREEILKWEMEKRRIIAQMNALAKEKIRASKQLKSQ